MLSLSYPALASLLALAGFIGAFIGVFACMVVCIKPPRK